MISGATSSSSKSTVVAEHRHVGCSWRDSFWVVALACAGATGLLGSVPLRAAAADPPTFADVAPILFEQCVGCHRGGAGAPFSLRSFEHARPRARAIAREVRARRMPPWKPEPGYGHLRGARRLSTQEIETLVAWGRDGGGQRCCQRAARAAANAGGLSARRARSGVRAARGLHPSGQLRQGRVSELRDRSGPGFGPARSSGRAPTAGRNAGASRDDPCGPQRRGPSLR